MLPALSCSYAAVSISTFTFADKDNTLLRASPFRIVSILRAGHGSLLRECGSVHQRQQLQALLFRLRRIHYAFQQYSSDAMRRRAGIFTFKSACAQNCAACGLSALENIDTRRTDPGRTPDGLTDLENLIDFRSRGRKPLFISSSVLTVFVLGVDDADERSSDTAFNDDDCRRRPLISRRFELLQYFQRISARHLRSPCEDGIDTKNCRKPAPRLQSGRLRNRLIYFDSSPV